MEKIVFQSPLAGGRVIEAVPVQDFAFGSMQQRAKAEAVGATHMIKIGDGSTGLPQYVRRKLDEMGMSACQVGYTTYVSQTWAVYKKKDVPG